MIISDNSCNSWTLFFLSIRIKCQSPLRRRTLLPSSAQGRNLIYLVERLIAVDADETLMRHIDH